MGSIVLSKTEVSANYMPCYFTNSVKSRQTGHGSVCCVASGTPASHALAQLLEEEGAPCFSGEAGMGVLKK